MINVFTSSGTIVNPQLTSAFHDLLYSLLQLILVGLSTLATWAIRTWLKNMQSGWKQTIAKRLVSYAAQKVAGDNSEKQKYVAYQLSKMFPRLSEEEINHLIEEAVVDLKGGLQ